MSRSGVIVARYRRHVTVECPDGRRWRCQTRGRRLSPLIGDDVHWLRESDETGIVTAVLPRRCELTRTDSRGRREIVAANLSQLLVIAAPEPSPDWFVVDRYLAAAELMRISAAVVYNKIDLSAARSETLADYRGIGYHVFLTSASERRGLDALAAIMAGQRSAMVGQSGVGKSSLINALIDDVVQDVGKLTGKGAHGRHTTTTAVMHRLANGGELIDSPGVRAYTPYIENPGDLDQGFAEFGNLPGRCRFTDCRHLEEPDCAVKTAVAEGRISERRYRSYRKLHALAESLSAKRAP